MFYSVLDRFCVVRKSRFSNIREDTKEKAYIFVYFKWWYWYVGLNKVFTKKTLRTFMSLITGFIVPLRRPFSTYPFIVWYGSYKYSFLPSYKFFLLTYHIYINVYMIFFTILNFTKIWSISMVKINFVCTQADIESCSAIFGFGFKQLF